MAKSMRVSLHDLASDIDGGMLYGNDLFSGVVELRGEDGQLVYEAEYVDGLEDGIVVRWHSSGVVAECMRMRSGVCDGDFYVWRENGRLRLWQVFEVGFLIESKYWSDRNELEQHFVVSPNDWYWNALQAYRRSVKSE
jgi:antitoxin component YwqK of YwqJK toxin-antitoxin module